MRSAESIASRKAHKAAFYKTPHGLALKRAWYQRHREEVLAKRKVERETQQEKLSVRRKAAYEENKDKVLAAQKIYREANPEKLKASKRRDYLKNKAHYNATSKAYYEANKPKMLEWQRQYEQENKEACRATAKSWKSKNIEHVRKKAREYANRRYLRDTDLLKARAKAFVEKHPEKVAARRKAYRYNNRDKCMAANSKRISAIQAATIGNPDEIKTLVKAWNSDPNTCCYYCAAPVYGTKFHVDHIIPISRNGAHHIDNLCPACVLCNLTKHDKLVSEWRPELSEEPVGRSIG